MNHFSALFWWEISFHWRVSRFLTIFSWFINIRWVWVHLMRWMIELRTLEFSQ
jgi:hypothetical protein